MWYKLVSLSTRSIFIYYLFDSLVWYSFTLKTKLVWVKFGDEKHFSFLNTKSKIKVSNLLSKQVIHFDGIKHSTPPELLLSPSLYFRLHFPEFYGGGNCLEVQETTLHLILCPVKIITYERTRGDDVVAHLFFVQCGWAYNLYIVLASYSLDRRKTNCQIGEENSLKLIE